MDCILKYSTLIHGFDKALFVNLNTKGLGMSQGWKGVDRMDERKEGKEESPIPMLILLAIIGLGAIFLVVFILFIE